MHLDSLWIAIIEGKEGEGKRKERPGRKGRQATVWTTISFPIFASSDIVQVGKYKMDFSIFLLFLSPDLIFIQGISQLFLPCIFLQIPLYKDTIVVMDCIIIIHHYHIQCIPLIGNYDQGLGKEGKWQLISIKKSAAKESLGSRKIHRWILRKAVVMDCVSPISYQETPRSPYLTL